MKEAIQYFGQKYHNNPEIYYLGGNALPEIVKDVVYDMFLNGFDNSNATEYKHWLSIRSYAQELHKNGFVTPK